MNIVPSGFTVADYCQGMTRGEIVTNKNYQRSEKVWPDSARSFFVETLLLGFPIPKLSLYQVTDLKSRKTYKEIVDGQQRSKAILDFFDDKLRLSKRLEMEGVGGRTYSELDPELQQRFVDYQLTVDLFVSATPKDVREVFRRMNAYTVPLNPEERRHAIYQGEFKWFVHRLARQFDQFMVEIGTFRDKDIVRMADAKLLSEVVHALMHGIAVTNSASLDKLYRSNDKTFDAEAQCREQIVRAFGDIAEWQTIWQGPLVVPYNLYALLLASIDSHYGVPALRSARPDRARSRSGLPEIQANLSVLAEALDSGQPGELADFVRACESKTNTRANRETRFRWFSRALEGDLVS